MTEVATGDKVSVYIYYIDAVLALTGSLVPHGMRKNNK